MSREILAAVTEVRPQVVVIDAAATLMTSVTVIDQLAELDDRIADLGATTWLAALPPKALELTSGLPAWSRWEAAGRLHPTAVEAVRAFARRTDGGPV